MPDQVRQRRHQLPAPRPARVRYAAEHVWVARGFRGCGDDLGQGGYQASTAAHELLHQLGALPEGAPHACPDDTGHPRDFGNDVLFGQSRPVGFADQGLDVGRDDYYGHSGSWWDAQDSRWLGEPGAPSYALRVSLEGAHAEDTVQSDPPAIDCPETCEAAWEGGERVRLLAEPGGDSRFLGSDECSDGYVCEITLDAAKHVTARFGPSSYGLSVSVTGRGRVVDRAAAFACSKRCSQPFEFESVVRVRAVPAKGWRFDRWSGACRGRQPCRLQAVKNLAVGALFRRA